MEGCASKRSVARLVMPRNMNKKDDKDVLFCSRIGCSAKVTSTKVTRNGLTDNNRKVGRPSLCSSSNGKEIVGSSSRTPGRFGYIRKPAKGTARRQPSPSLDLDSSETGSSHDDHSSSEPPTLPRQKIKRGAINVHSQSSISGEVAMAKAVSSGRGASRSSNQKLDLGTRDAPTGPSVSSSPGNNEHAARSGLSRNRLRNLKCTSVSDVLRTNSSSATKITLTKKKNTDGESSSASKGNNTSLLLPKGRNQNSLSANSTAVSDNRRNRLVPTIRDNGIVSSSGRRSGYSGRSGRLGTLASSATSQQTPPATSQETPHTATPTDPTNRSLSFSPSNSSSRPSSSSGRLHSMTPDSPTEVDASRSLVNGGSLSRYNMNGIAEVLLALQRIEREEALVYDQLASLETNIFSSGMFRFYDQHRDMRLDIDNMSYEELLALGDKIGTVSTALSEEALSRSVKKSIYQEPDETGANSLNKDDDIKCSICQEEYVDGDEVGTMLCQHMYHVSCVEQWLRMKNWCPICKTSAEKEPPR